MGDKEIAIIILIVIVVFVLIIWLTGIPVRRAERMIELEIQDENIEIEKENVENQVKQDYVKLTTESNEFLVNVCSECGKANVNRRNCFNCNNLLV